MIQSTRNTTEIMNERITKPTAADITVETAEIGKPFFYSTFSGLCSVWFDLAPQRLELFSFSFFSLKATHLRLCKSIRISKKEKYKSSNFCVDKYLFVCNVCFAVQIILATVLGQKQIYNAQAHHKTLLRNNYEQFFFTKKLQKIHHFFYQF